MKYLPILFLILFLSKQKNGNLANLLSGIDLNSLSPVFEILGISPEICETLKSQEIADLLQGKMELKTLIPLLTPIISEFARKKQNEKDDDVSPSIDNYYLSPIEDFANGTIKNNLKNFFNG